MPRATGASTHCGVLAGKGGGLMVAEAKCTIPGG